ncbi:MAG: pectinacetylesterase family protein [Anaerolineae bacterium]|nr:pectinacetylesterase family protein [Anaerolineae bacterium]
MKPELSLKGLLAILFSMALFSFSAAQESAPLPGLGDLVEGWNTISPGGDTLCSNGTPYLFYVRPAAESNNLLIYFNGGGACWLGQNCDLNAQPTYLPTADLVVSNPGIAGAGIFDLENAENPFLNYNMVFLPYCTADVLLGNRVTTYDVPADGDVPAHTVTIHHNGFHNVRAVLEWVYANFAAPERIFMAGSSAGAPASPFYTDLVADHYPNAHIAQLGDGAGGYRSDQSPVFMDAWGVMSILPDTPEYTAVTLDQLTFETFYIIAARRHPNITFTQYNTAHDESQYFFLSLLGMTDTLLPELLLANFSDIHAAVPDNAYAYTAGGMLHTILRRPEFYTYAVQGIRFVDWVTALANGEPVENVTCSDCYDPPDVAAAADK